MKIKTFLGFLFLFLSLVTAGLVFSQEKILDSQRAQQAIQIDGQADEWSQEALFFEKSSKVQCAFQNDEENLYVLLVFEDPKSLSSIHLTGITLSFNAEGKKKKTTGIHFIKKMLTPEEAIGELEKQGEILSEEQKQLIRSKAGVVVFAAEMVKEKDHPGPTETLVPGSSKPAFKTSEGRDRVVYEFRIPLARSEANPFGIGSAPGQILAVNFEWGGMTEEMRKAMQARARAELGGGIDRESGAGTVIVPGREGGGPPGSGSTAVPKKYSFWARVKLAGNE